MNQSTSSDCKSFNSKKLKIFSRDEVDKFLLEAPDKEFPMVKVALIMGLAGACRCDELTKLCLDDIDDKGDILIVKSSVTKTYKSRNFVVIQGNNGINISLYKKYVALRPSHITHQRLFVYYRGAKCSVQPVGLHTFAKIPAKIASYLCLPQSELYTGHSLRRTSATLLVDGGGDITTLKRHGGWRSNSIAEGYYIEESLQSKISIANQIQHQQHLKPNEDINKMGDSFQSEIIPSRCISVTSNNVQDPASACHVTFEKSSTSVPSSINISNVQNTTIHINISR